MFTAVALHPLRSTETGWPETWRSYDAVRCMEVAVGNYDSAKGRLRPRAHGRGQLFQKMGIEAGANEGAPLKGRHRARGSPSHGRTVPGDHRGLRMKEV